MINFFRDNRVNFLFLLIAFICMACVVGFHNIHFQNTEWLYSGEPAMHQLGWYFFKNDVWRFPLGVNPNYGDEIGSSIIFSDSIPILALFFKLFKSFISENFQYFSFWYLICFYFQLYFSFKILKKFTNSNLYSIVGSLFFLIAPIFIYRINLHSALAGQWILLFTIYLGLIHKIDKSKFSWIFLIILSSLIHFYFTAMILVVYFLLRLFHFYFEKENLFNVFKDLSLVAISILFVMYLVGYFEIRIADSLGVGFGWFKLNLLSIFDSTNSIKNISWSFFLPDIKLTSGEELEGFNYLGLGQILMSIFVLILFLNKNYKSNFLFIKNKKEILAFLVISLIFTFWALSNKISLGSYTFEIPLNKYIYGVLSIIKSSGRAFWLVTYFLLIISIVVIFKCFGKKKSLSILFLFLIIQIVDISTGLKNYIRPFDSKENNFFSLNKSDILQDQIWEELFKRNKVIKSTYPISWSDLFSKFAYATEKYNIEKTNLVIFARSNRKANAEARYNLYNNFRLKKLESNTVYVIHSLSHMRNLKHLFSNEDIGFFYRDNVWSMVKNEKELMDNSDIKIFNEIKPKLLEINKSEKLYFNKKDNYYGFGWSHNFQEQGIWSEGKISSLLFTTKEDYGDIKMELTFKPYITNKQKFLEFDIIVNNILNKEIKLSLKELKNKDKKIEIFIDKNNIHDNQVVIDFDFKNPISPMEVFESPDSRKLGILMKNIRISTI